MIGIYKITNPKGFVYIGQSINIQRRFNEYKSLSNSRNQIKLYNSFKKYGINTHVFSVVECCDILDLNTKERYYQDFFDCIGKLGLNLKLQSTSLLKEIPSLETKIKISESMKLKHKDPNFKLKMILSRKGVKRSEETKLKIKSLGNKNYSHLKIGVSGEFSPASKKVIDTRTSIVYFSAKQASIELNINYSTLKTILQGKTKNKSIKYL